jgi:hypothetical protein
VNGIQFAEVKVNLLSLRSYNRVSMSHVSFYSINIRKSACILRKH